MKKLRDQHYLIFWGEEHVTPFWTWLIRVYWNKMKCFIFGHKLKCETEGDGESGPITYYWCERGCETNFKSHWGM